MTLFLSNSFHDSLSLSLPLSKLPTQKLNHDILIHLNFGQCKFENHQTLSFIKNISKIKTLLCE